jgi:hypothetical protein
MRIGTSDAFLSTVHDRQAAGRFELPANAPHECGAADIYAAFNAFDYKTISLPRCNNFFAWQAPLPIHSLML